MAAPAHKTRMDLAKAALLEIRVLRGGEAPTDVAKAQSDQKYDAIYAELGVIGVAFWDADAIPVSVFDPVTMLVAQRLAPSFGKEYSSGDAMTRLYAVAGKPWSGRTVRAEYF
jgi:hypothetical protein